MYSTWPANKQDFPLEGEDSFSELQKVAESLGAHAKLRGRGTVARPRPNYLTIHGENCFEVYHMFLGVARRLGWDMSRVLLPHEGTLRRLKDWKDLESPTQASIEVLITDGTIDTVADADNQQNDDDQAGLKPPYMEPIPEEEGPDWGGSTSSEDEVADMVSNDDEPVNSVSVDHQTVRL